MLGEFELIARYFAPLARGAPGAYGLLDDAAVIAPRPGHELVAKTDAIVGGVHFLADDPPQLVARKALRVNLSDLAAKGAVPRAYLLDLMLPPAIGEAWIADFARGLSQDQAQYGVHLIGGDTDCTTGPATVAVMALGEVPVGRMIRRSGARAGDFVFVTGTIGDAVLGLEALRGRLSGLEASFLVERYRLPQPRVELGPRLMGVANAAIDVSDGLVADLGHICEVSGLAATIEAASVPLSGSARQALAHADACIDALLTGGDDYEILFTTGAERASVIAALAEDAGVPITAIGRMHALQPGGEPRVAVLDASGNPLSLPRTGWTHF